jgi:hypothetical protein
MTMMDLFHLGFFIRRLWEAIFCERSAGQGIPIVHVADQNVFQLAQQPWKTSDNVDGRKDDVTIGGLSKAIYDRSAMGY